MSNEYANWMKRIEVLKSDLRRKPGLLEQYAVWLETSENITNFRGENIYHMLVGAMQALSDINFIPGVGNHNLVVVLGELQKEMKLDLGVCPFLVNNIRNSMRFIYTGEKIGENMAKCDAKSNLYIADLTVCLPPKRLECEHRIKRLKDL